MAAAANVLRNGHGRTALERTNLMFIVAASAGRRVLGAGGDRFAMNALRPIARFLVMARAAGLRLPRKINRRGWRVAGNHFVRIVTVLTGRRVCMPGLQSEAVNARIKTFRLPRVANRAVHPRHRFIIVWMFVGNVRMATDAGIRCVRGRF